MENVQELINHLKQSIDKGKAYIGRSKTKWYKVEITMSSEEAECLLKELETVIKQEGIILNSQSLTTQIDDYDLFEDLPELIPEGCIGGVATELDTLQEGDWFEGTEEEYRKVLEMEGTMRQSKRDEFISECVEHYGMVYTEEFGYGMIDNLTSYRKTKLKVQEFLLRAENTFKTK